jgi:porin
VATLKRNTALLLTAAALLVLVLARPVPAQDAAADQSPKTKSGYEDVPQFGGPSSTGAQLEENDEVREPLLRFPGIDKALKPWFDFKANLNKKHGFSFGFDYNALYQGVSDSLGEDTAAGGIFRAYGSWTLLGRDTGHRGSLTWKVENRHRLGTDIAPQNLGFAAGYNGITGTMFSDYEWGVTNLFWRQEFSQGRFVVLAGKVDPTDYLDVYGLINPLTAFQNLSFLTNPTIAAPNQSLGLAGGAMITDNLYIPVADFSDANRDATKSGFDTFFDDNEYFNQIEFGWTSSKDRIYFDNVRLTAWHQNTREKANVEDSRGLAFSATKFINDTWISFLRAGWSDGNAPLLEATVSAGVG